MLANSAFGAATSFVHIHHITQTAGLTGQLIIIIISVASLRLRESVAQHLHVCISNYYLYQRQIGRVTESLIPSKKNSRDRRRKRLHEVGEVGEGGEDKSSKRVAMLLATIIIAEIL
jgi:hypothetical protein